MFSRLSRVVRAHLPKLKVSYNTAVKPIVFRVPKNGLMIPCALGFSFYTLFGFEKNLTAEDELIQTIKHCVLFIQRSDYGKAEQLLHVALRQAQQIQHQLGITYIYDIMANLALERQQYDKAKDLFVAVSQRLLTDGVDQEDFRIIHISVKLARISHMKKEFEVAQLGYDWCLDKLKTILQNVPNDETIKLLAMAEDWYGRLYMDFRQYENAYKLMSSALDRMKQVQNMEQDQVVQQYNDLATICDCSGKLDEGIAYLQQAIELAKLVPEYDQLGTIHVNLGRIYLKKKLLEDARKHCGFGWRLAYQAKQDDIKKEAEKCIKEVNKTKI